MWAIVTLWDHNMSSFWGNEIGRRDVKEWHAITLLWLLGGPLDAQGPPPPADTTLQGITARGRSLATYDGVAWRATDALLAGNSGMQGIEGFIARPRSPGSWDVLFGRLNASGDSLLLAATITEPVATGARQIAFHRPAVLGSDADRRAFLAMRTTAAVLASIPRPHPGTYNPYVIARDDGSWWVYFLPAQAQTNVYPHGGDFRFVVSASGATILERHQMHNAVLQFPRMPDDVVAGAHSVVTGHVPQDSDVFLVLTRKPARPELIATQFFHYQIAADGSITWRHATR
jgi:hypothetical protein